jgi:uncharacterized protein (TIGR03086 family)
VIPDDIVELHRRAVERFGELVHQVRPEQWEDPTPCTEWDVRALVNHVTVEDLWAEQLFAGRTIAEVGDALEGDVLGSDPIATWDRAAAASLALIEAPGAMDRQVDLSRGPTPGRGYTVELFNDHVMHAWDLAEGIGVDAALDGEVVDAARVWFATVEDEYRSWGAIAERPSIPDDADEMTVFLAMSGRSRDWRSQER